MKKIIAYFVLLIIFLVNVGISYATQTLVALKVEEPPLIDGKADALWDNIKGIKALDKIANIEIELKAVYTNNQIFFLVSFPDADESRSHKSWVWDKTNQIYQTGDDREDVFVFKWNMQAQKRDLSIYADNPYQADIWYWKAYRSDPAGFADDKIDTLSLKPIAVKGEMVESVTLESKTGNKLYLLRQPDEGEPAFRSEVYVEYRGEIVPRFVHQAPSGSLADVKTKGTWQDGRWTIEFSRALDTGHPDDVRFETGKEYQFGVSRYEISGRGPNPKLSQPLYGCGDTGEDLILIFGK